MSDTSEYSFDNLRRSIDMNRTPYGSCILRPTHVGLGFIEMDADFLLKAITELEKKALCVQAGLETFSCVEQVLLRLLFAHATQS